jgi:uncharacterized protein YndB with AHSA1/START domain
MKKIDVAAVIGAVKRELKSTVRDGKPAVTLTATRIYDTGIDDAWDALTNKERIPRWFLPIEGELKLGGRYQLVGNAGGTITACEPPRHVALTWGMKPEEPSWVDIRLEPVGKDRTKLTLEHTAHVDEKLWDQWGPGGVGIGWDLGLLGLYMHFANGGTGVTKEGQEWAASDEGKRFQNEVSDDWARASIEMGTDETKAREAAARVYAAYTGG